MLVGLGPPHRAHLGVEPGAVLVVVQVHVGQLGPLGRAHAGDAVPGQLVAQLVRGVERQQRGAALSGHEHDGAVERPVEVPALGPARARQQLALVDAPGGEVVEHALERLLEHLHAQRLAHPGGAGAHGQRVDQVQLRPVMMGIGVLLTDADRVGGRDLGHELIPRHLLAAVGPEDLERQGGGLDPARAAGSLGPGMSGATATSGGTEEESGQQGGATHRRAW